MPERNHELIIDGYVYPDTITVTLSNGDFVGSRDYVSKGLCDSINDANAAWQAENAKLRELAKEATKVAHVLCSVYSAPCSLCAVDRCDTGCKLDWIDELACELGIEIPSD